MYHIFFSKYLPTLHQVIMYHGYIKKVIRNGIFWHYDGSFGFSSCHFTYFIGGLRFPLIIQLGAPTFLGWVMITLTLSFVSNEMITLFFSMWWHMPRLKFFLFNWHCKMLEFYYPRFSILKSLMRIFWYNCISLINFFDELPTLWRSLPHF